MRASRAEGSRPKLEAAAYSAIRLTNVAKAVSDGYIPASNESADSHMPNAWEPLSGNTKR